MPILTRLVRAWLATAITDGLFSSVLAAFIYRSGVARLWQGVASTLAGPGAIGGGSKYVAMGLAMHLGVAFGWSTVFLLVVSRLGAVQRTLASPAGALKVAAVYGPCIWMVMSFAVIPLLTHRPVPMTIRWWVQFFGHIPFVALPMILAAGRE